MGTIPGATSRGVEVESTFSLSEAITLTGGVQWLDATYDEGLGPLTNAPGRLPLGGEDLSFASEVTGTLGVNLEAPIANGDWRFFWSTNAYFRSDYFNFTEPVVGREQDGYVLFNVRAGIGNDNWEFSAWCRNCGDERVTWSNFGEIPFDGLVLAPPGAAHGTQWSHVAEPRIIGATATYRF